ncbi:hypothetical protein [Massilia litorea]|jgi:hypothetical protein|uniref:Uncharacterized protein n=1 Tax=Massilia litorea TaxID=2769491 RepID=A0A7L9TZ10_9BURK|nr:hypothetical protein [Massilia litorea]QOL47928.1 hypothetical protein LPB04_12950 [Massilia litorea]
MSIDRRILAILGARLPAIFDLIPRGPLSLAALNAQLLPAHELGAAIAAEFAHTAWQADRFGLDPAIAFMDLDDWCPTRPRPPRLPPWWGPHRGLGPHPEPWSQESHADFHIGFASRLAWASSQIDSPALRESFDKAIERSIEAIDSGTP